MSKKFLLLSLSALLPLLVPLLIASPARATDCTYAGQTYSPGSTVGPYTCQPDGSWQ